MDFVLLAGILGKKKDIFYQLKKSCQEQKKPGNMDATEVCIQAGLAPKHGWVSLCGHIVKAIKKELPDIHIHAFSPEEILYASLKSNTICRRIFKNVKGSWYRKFTWNIC